MNALKSLPTPAKIAIAGAAAALIVGIAYVVAFTGPSWTTVTSSTDPAEIQAWTLKLDNADIDSRTVPTDAGMEIQVESSNENAARTALQLASSKLPKRTACTKPGTLAGNAERNAWDRCQKERDIEEALEGMGGITAARAKVNEQESGNFTGAEMIQSAVVTVALDPSAADTLDAKIAATTVANLLDGATTEHVIINDQGGTALWVKGKSSATSGGGTDECGMTSAVTSITDKEQIVRCNIESQLRKQIAPIVGGEQHVKVTAGVTLSPEASTYTTDQVTKGALTTESTTSGDGANSADRTYAPGSNRTAGTREAGYIERLMLTAILDGSVATAAQQKAVREVLAAYRNEKRGDPQPHVQIVQFNAPEKADDAASAQPTTSSTPVTPSSKGIPGSLMALLFVIGVGLIATVALLTRKNARMADERRRFEEEFQNEQQLFRTYAQNNPDDLVRDLEQMLGAPAHRPTTHA